VPELPSNVGEEDHNHDQVIGVVHMEVMRRKEPGAKEGEE